MEDLVLHSWMLWLIVLIAFLIAEAVTQGLTTIWFAIGALAAMLTSFVRPDPLIGLLVFIIVSLISLILTRPLAAKWTTRRAVPTNIDRLVGSVHTVQEQITAEGGMLRIGDIDWRVQLCPPPQHNEIQQIEAGEKVVIERIEGNLLWIRRE